PADAPPLADLARGIRPPGPELPGLDVCSRPVGHRDRPDRQLVRRHSGLRDRAGLLARRGDDPPGAALPAEYRHRGGSRPAGRGVQPRLWPVQPVQYHQRGAAPAADPGRRPERAHPGWAVPAGDPGDRRRGHRLPLRAPAQLRGAPGLHGPGSRRRCLGAPLHRTPGGPALRPTQAFVAVATAHRFVRQRSYVESPVFTGLGAGVAALVLTFIGAWLARGVLGTVGITGPLPWLAAVEAGGWLLLPAT